METKICSHCGIEKPIEEFAYRDKAKGTRRAECKQCINEKMKKKYYEKKDALNDYKKQQHCIKCGENRFYVLDFHHLDPTTKVNTVAKLAAHSSPDSMWKEIDKCVCLCANCHREFHYLNKEQGITLEEYCGLV